MMMPDNVKSLSPGTAQRGSRIRCHRGSVPGTTEQTDRHRESHGQLGQSGVSLRRLTNEEAIERMRAAGAEPLEPYVGADEPWLCACLTCGEVGYPRLSAVKNGRQGPCQPCGRRKANSAMRIPSDEAVAAMAAAGFDPIGPYPGYAAAWSCRCRVSSTLPLLRTAIHQQVG